MQKFAKNSIWTKLEIIIREEKNLSHLFSEIDIFLNNFEQKFSRFIPNNWLFELNSRGENELCEDGYNMIFFMQKIACGTSGYFDPTIWKRLSELGYGNKEIFFYNPDFHHRDFDDIISFSRNKIVIKKWYEIEFGWIWKWYLLGWIFDFLTKSLWKNTEFLVNFGWDMVCQGSFNIALESPFSDDEAIWTLILENSFLACSSPSRRKFWQNHHLINPFDWKSSSEVVAVFLETPNNVPYGWMLTDGFATALSVMNFEKSSEILQKNNFLEWMIIYKTWKFFKTEKSKIKIF